MNDNVKIPLSLFKRVIDILETINAYNYDDIFQLEYFGVIDALNKKKDALDLREAYADIVRAKDDDTRHRARMRYLQQKRLINEGF